MKPLRPQTRPAFSLRRLGRHWKPIQPDHGIFKIIRGDRHAKASVFQFVRKIWYALESATLHREFDLREITSPSISITNFFMRCDLRGLTEKNSIGTSKISEHAILIAITIEQFVGDPEEGSAEFCTTACRSRSELLVNRLRPAPSCDLPSGVTLRDCEEYVQITAARIITTGDPTNHQ